ncbi:MAG: right-handed parallel beta-helix repeat-containing protein [Ardenticatenaceae bacterium]
MLICLHQHNGNYCNTQNRNGANYCAQCGGGLHLHSALPVQNRGTLVRRYRIVRMIGHGAFGAVYEAEDTQDGNRRVALKETLKSNRIQSFREEFKVLQGLRHDHLPRYYDMFEATGRGYLVMELIPGQDLKEVLDKKKQPLLEGQVLGYALQLCKALSYLHNQNPVILHRDIKPANIRLTPDGLIKLVDFGLLKVGKQTTHRWRRGWTPAYAPIEQQWGGGTDPRSDLYSLGATLYHLLTNRVPLSALKRMASSPDPLRSPSELNSIVSQHVADAIMKAMAVDAQDRYADVARMRHALVTVGAQVVPASRLQTTVIGGVTQIDPNVAPLQFTTTEPMTTPPVSQAGHGHRLVQAPQLVTNSIKTFVVSQRGGGNYKTISEAIQNAAVGSLILVRPGLYAESLVIDKALEISGDGPLKDIVVQSVDASCLRMQCQRAEVRGLTLRARVGPKSKQFYAVDIPQGELLLEDCDIRSDSLACVAIHGADATPVLRRCKIHDGQQAGVFVYDNAQGKLEACDIFANVRAGVVITQGANPLVQNCRIYDGKANGVYAYYKGQGTIEECQIFGNAYAGVAIKQGGNPVVRRCEIHDGLQSGVRVYKDGKGTIEECEIFGNAEAGVEIKLAGNPVIRGCKIHDGQQDGIFVGENGQGTIEECEIFSNAHAGMRIGQNANPVMRRCQIKRNKYQIVKEDKNSVIRLEKGNLTGHAHSAWHIESRLLGKP